MRRRVTALAISVVVAGGASGCGVADRAMPRCEPDQRLGLVAQSVPSAAYVPCIEELPPGWALDDVEVRKGRTSFVLRSDRAVVPVRVELVPECETRGATPVPPRAEGVRTLQLVRAVSPDYVGTLLDVFPGGCITYRFEFERGPHIALVDELQQAIGLYPRRDLRLELRDRLGVDLAD